MSNQIIQPWLHENLTGELYVPTYVEEMADIVLLEYDLSVKDRTLIATKDEQGGAIWKINTDKGPFSLKLLHRRPTKSKFSLGAQEYLVEVRKARVPAIFKTKQGENYVERGGKLWFVAEWNETLYQLPEDLEGTKKLCYALGEFHQLTKGYVPPGDAEFVSRLHRWPRAYERIEKKIGWFRDIATAYKEYPASGIILDSVDVFQEQARQARIRLENSSYADILAKGTEEAGLVHQDYGWSNAQMGDDGVWVIDLDGVSFDITIRDLRKLIAGCMNTMGRWDVDFAREMIKAYDEANPISDEVYELLMIDLSLPSLFYKNVKDIVYSPTTFMTVELEQEIQKYIEMDQQKWPVLEQLALDRKGGQSE
ncbi:CotS family spore coat protein [Halobacillus sp. A5]|uniref:CotS family spore coat protein n=1 Tax=Halobacillus sp. A5 TaxID=2880263 RepID=UPI0020A66CBB|nr:CotS family spore coat protein [Halobacillus sp. A5]MCP3029434.1 CotS family spore coat protein [Halobacillus sp. A5]